MKALIDRFLPHWMRFQHLFPAISCIEQTRILYECLRDQVPVKPVETRLIVRCDELSLAYIGGSTAAQRAETFRHKPADEIVDRHTPGAADVGHVVAIVGGAWLVDLTLAQAAMPEKGLAIERQGLAVGPLPTSPEEGSQIEAGVILNSGIELKIEWTLTGRRDFERTEAWEPSHLWPLIHRIRREMKWAEVVARTVRER